MMDLQKNVLGLKTVFLFEARKLLVHKRWMLIAILAVMVGAVMGYAATRTGANTDSASNVLELLVLTFLLPVLALIYGASMLRNEMDDRSIIQVVTSPLDRRTSHVGYYLALTVVLAVLLAVITIIGGVCFMAMNGSGGGLELIAGYVAVLLVGAMAYSALFLVMGVVLKQPLYLGLFYVFIWEYFIGSVPGAVGEITIRHQLLVIGGGIIDHGHIATTAGDAGWSLVIMIVLSAILVVLGSYLFREKEIS